MAGITVKQRRGTTTEHSAFTGALGEVTVDSTKKVVVVHDGTTAGGFPLNRTYSTTFTAQTTVTVTHNLNTTDIIVACYNSSNVQISPTSVTINTSNTCTVVFSGSTTGKIVVK